MSHSRPIRSMGRKKRLMGEINVVPYIDVMLVLLIIFMVTAPLLSQGVKIDLPKARAELMAEENNEPFVVTVDAAGNYYLNDDREQAASPGEIELKARAVLRRNPGTPFLVRGDGAAAYADVVQAMVLLQAAGVESVGLVTETPES
ncbi:MAG: protein TolR [Gammaproteobacteria bacterium]|nr:protein TolR [Gammaproteobacteria bacterium]MDD9874704.1 protein TolR [Gammaproteobacteria bacterium]